MIYLIALQPQVLGIIESPHNYYLCTHNYDDSCMHAAGVTRLHVLLWFNFLFLTVNSRYEPPLRSTHKTIRVGSNVYMWAGVVDGMPQIHDSQKKKQFTSCVEVFHSESGDWISQPTSGAPPLGVSGYGCTAVGDTLHFFGGYCNHADCYHNSIHSLSTSSLHWVELSPTTSKSGAPMKKGSCGMVAFKSGEEDFLYVVAGWGPTPSYRQPGAQYETITGIRDRVRCNEHHMFSLSTSE